jgi:hypothetical protein
MHGYPYARWGTKQSTVLRMANGAPLSRQDQMPRGVTADSDGVGDGAYGNGAVDVRELLAARLGRLAADRREYPVPVDDKNNKVVIVHVAVNELGDGGQLVPERAVDEPLIFEHDPAGRHGVLAGPSRFQPGDTLG